jgi:hypothetical protein
MNELMINLLTSYYRQALLLSQYHLDLKKLLLNRK